MESETKTHSTHSTSSGQASSVQVCQNCKLDFTIDPEDFLFYEKIKVPPPTFCPECRMIRRMMWRNVRSLYRRECTLCKKVLVSMYKEDTAPVMCSDCFNGDDWDQYQYAQDIDWRKSFLSQLNELFKKQPRIFQYRIGTVINSDYGNSIVNTKNAYLSYSVIDCENVMYSETIDRSKDSLDNLAVQDINQCSWNISSNNNYNSHFLVNSQSCIDSSFLFDCTNCQNCCLSSNQRNQQYVFRNKKLSKEEYDLEIQKLNLETWTGFNSAIQILKEISMKSIHRFSQIISSQNVTGDYVFNSKNIRNSFDVWQNSEDVKNSARVISCKETVDCYALMTAELVYECLSASGNTYKQICSVLCLSSKNMEYSLFCKNSSDCFGCVGLKNAKYCILNKQYEKGEYFKLTEKIRETMNILPYRDSLDRTYSYGEFLPFEFSPFSYNETVDQDYFPISKEKATTMGYPWKDREKREYAITKRTSDLPDSILDVTDDVLQETIGCPNEGNSDTQCTVAFRLTPEELQFYRQKKMPLPRYCPNCRHYQRLKYRNPMRLYTRTCSNGCGNTFETTYSPDRPEKVYYESCYQKEVL